MTINKAQVFLMRSRRTEKQAKIKVKFLPCDTAKKTFVLNKKRNFDSFQLSYKFSYTNNTPRYNETQAKKENCEF